MYIEEHMCMQQQLVKKIDHVFEGEWVGVNGCIRKEEGEGRNIVVYYYLKKKYLKPVQFQ